MRKHLPIKDQFRLMKFIEAEYTNSKMTDGMFAAKAGEALGFVLNANHISRWRNQLEIPAFKVIPVKAVASAALAERVRLLETQVAAILLELGK